MLSPKFFVSKSSKLNNTIRLISLFSQKKPKTPEIQPFNYHISTARAKDIELTLNFIEENYFKDEPLSKNLNITRKSLQGPLEVFIKDSIKQGMTLIAKGNLSNEIIGASVNIRSCKFDVKKYEDFVKCTKSSNTKKLLNIWALLGRESQVHDLLHQLCLFEIKMLAVKKEYQGQNLGTELFRNSLKLATDMNFMYAVTTCTNMYAKKIIETQNMKRLLDVNFRNILLNDAKTPVSIPEPPHSSASVWIIDLKT